MLLAYWCGDATRRGYSAETRLGKGLVPSGPERGGESSVVYGRAFLVDVSVDVNGSFDPICRTSTS